MTDNYRRDIQELLDDRFADDPRVMSGLMFGHPGYKREGRVFCFVYDDGLTIKLSKADYAACLELEEARAFTPRGTPMGTWVVLTYADAPEYLEHWHWIEQALDYIVTDAAAPPKKKKKR